MAQAFLGLSLNFLKVVISVHYPEKPLDTLFKECYYIHLDHEGGTGRIPVIDDCCYDLVFFKEAAGIFYYGESPKKVTIKNKVFTIHNLKPPYRIEGTDTLTFFTIKLQPWANAHFFSSLGNEGVVDISKFDSQLLPFFQQVFAIDEVSGKFTLADDFMNANLFELTPSMELVKEICEYVYESKGKITVNQLSEHFNRSRQYLGKVFKKEVMYSLKKFILTVRILDLVKYKAKNPNVLLTRLGYDYGYFDQPHFINDFKKVCGVNPLQFFNNLPEFLLRH